MKSYKNVVLFAKNAPRGSYAAGCPTHKRGETPPPPGQRYGGRRYVVDSDGVRHFSDDPAEFDYCRHCELFN